MEDIIIFNHRRVDELAAYDFFNARNLNSFRKQLADKNDVIESVSRFAIDVRKKVIVATDKTMREDAANYVNRKYFTSIKAEILPCAGSVVYPNKLELCRVEKEIIWFTNDILALETKFHPPVVPYSFNWNRFPMMGERRSKVILLLLGHKDKIKETING